MHLETDGTIHVEHVQDVESTLDYAHAARNHRFDALSPSGDFKEEAAVPYVLLMKWAQEAGCGIFDDEMSIIMEKKLQLPEYAHLLTAPKMRDPRIKLKGLR